MIQLGSKITPLWRSVAGFPPCGEKHVDQKQSADDASRTHPQAEEKSNTDQQLENADKVSEEDSMRLHHTRQKWPIETDCAICDEILKVGLETAMGKGGSCHLVFAKKKEEYRRYNTCCGNRPQQGGGREHQLRFTGQIPQR